MALWLIALCGCAWLTDVPEDRVPERNVGEETINRVSNKVDAVEYKDPTMKPKLNALPEPDAGSEGASGDKPRWNPVSTPVAYDEKKSEPFVFKTSSGTVIKSGTMGKNGTGYPTAKELGITEAELQAMIKGGELQRR